MPRTMHKALALILSIAVGAGLISFIIPSPIYAQTYLDANAAYGSVDDPSSTQTTGGGGGNNAAGQAAGASASAMAPALASCSANMAAIGAGIASATGAAASAIPIAVTTTPAPQNAAIEGSNTASNIQNNVKQNCLNAIAWAVAKIMINQITQSTVNWINSGFKGSPTFISDPGGFFANVADEEIVGFMNELFPETKGITDFLCSPFSFELEFNLRFKFQYNSRFRDKVKCRISDITRNVGEFGKSAEQSLNDFYGGDFSNEGGWNRWFEVTQMPENNRAGAQLLAEAELNARIESSVGREKMIADWGQGFHSITEPIIGGFNQIVTPGKTIESALSNVTQTDLRQLELADEFNEIVGALMAQLMKTAFSAGSGGIAGLSRSPSNSNKSSFASRLTTGDNAYVAPEIPESAKIENVLKTTTAIEYNGSSTLFNMAHGKPAQQFTGDVDQYYAARAVDGITEMDGNKFIQNVGTINECAISEAPYTWWQVDLENIRTIKKIKIYPDRTTNGFLTNFYVIISKDPFPTEAVALKSTTNKTTPAPTSLITLPGVFSINVTTELSPEGTVYVEAGKPIQKLPLQISVGGEAGVQGRYVRIQRFDTNYNWGGTSNKTVARIDVCEVEVMGY